MENQKQTGGNASSSVSGRGARWIACLVLLYAVAAQGSDPLSFASDEVKRILAHGPWPPPGAPDPSNRVSGRPQAIALGERLFFSPRLSGGGTLLCASCHEPWRGYADGRMRGLGIQALERNTPTVLNARLNRWFGWDGANDNLWAQSIRPLLEPREMGSNATAIAALIRGDADLAKEYRAAFGAGLPTDDEALFVDVGKALAAYQETLVSDRTPFDEFRDALAKGDSLPSAGYQVAAQRGLKLFIGKGQCARCHAGPNFTDGAFHRVGAAPGNAGEVPDMGRQTGIRKLLASRYNLLGPYNDDP